MVCMSCCSREWSSRFVQTTCTSSERVCRSCWSRYSLPCTHSPSQVSAGGEINPFSIPKISRLHRALTVTAGHSRSRSCPPLSYRRVHKYNMLKFLEGREGEGKLRTTIRKRPEIAFGVSLEAPTTFQSQFSMISPSSYVNPYVEMERRRLEQVAPAKVGSLSPPWTHKTNISLVEEGRVIGSGDLQPRPDRYHLNYNEEMRKNHSRFRLTKGEFTNYIERNHLNNEGFGPLYGEERSQEKSLETKQSIMRKSVLMLEKSREKLELEQLLRKKSSKELERLLDEKRTLRHKRDDLYSHHRSELSERKEKLQQSFILPKVMTHRDKDKQSRQLDFGIFRTIDNSVISNYIK